jgi:hypothetical protein
MKARTERTTANGVPITPCRLVIKRVIPVTGTPWRETMARSEMEERKFQNENEWMKVWNMGLPTGGSLVRRAPELVGKRQQVGAVLSKG